MGTRFYGIVVQRNREQLEKVYDYYLNSTNKEDFNPAFLHDIEESLSGNPKHTLVLYATEYFLYVNDMKKELEKPIYGGQDLDDLLYFFDVDYILHELEQMERSGKTEDGWNFPVIESFTLPIYAKYIILQASGLESAAEYNMNAFDRQIEEELTRPKYGGSSLSDLTQEISSDEDFQDSLLFRAIANAYVVLAESSISSITGRLTIKHTDKLDFPLDKINSKVWGLLEEDTHGQLTFAMEKKGSRRPINLTYSIDFDELEGKGFKLSKRLTAFDKRCYMAISSLYNAGNIDGMSLTQIHYCMGNEKAPSALQTKKIRDSIEKMAAARVTIINQDDYAKYGSFDVRHRYLLPVNMDETYNINGAVTNGVVRVLDEPVLMKFAKSRNQITTIPIKLLQSPINKTDTNLAIDDYLIERIKRAKHGKGKSVKILLSTLWDRINITDKKQKQRTPDTVKRYLDYYETCGEIVSYKFDESDKSITIKLS